MWRQAVLRWKETTDRPVEKLGNKVMSSLDWTVQAFVDARISSEANLQPDGVESILKVLRRKMTTDHPAEKLGTKVMNSLDWTVQAFKDGRISTEALLQPDAVESILKV